MTSRDKLIQNYIMRQKELATIQERFNKLQNEMDDKKKLFNRT